MLNDREWDEIIRDASPELQTIHSTLKQLQELMDELTPWVEELIIVEHGDLEYRAEQLRQATLQAWTLRVRAFRLHALLNQYEVEPTCEIPL